MGESEAVAANPTFHFEDVHGRLWTYRPEAYEHYDYSSDGNWVTLTCRAADGRLVRRTFFVGYPG